MNADQDKEDAPEQNDNEKKSEAKSHAADINPGFSSAEKRQD